MIKNERFVTKLKFKAKHWQFWIRVMLLPAVWLLCLLAAIGDGCDSAINWIDRNLPTIPR